MKKACIFILSLFLCSGCSTILTHLSPSEQFDFGYYNGIRADYGVIMRSKHGPNPENPDKHTFVYTFSWDTYAILDFPFSLAGDTLFLPIDAYIATDGFLGSYPYPRECYSPITTVPISEEALSNVLAYYIMVDNGREINSTDFVGHTGPKPNVVITNIESFSFNPPTDLVRDQYYYTGHVSSAFSVTLFGKDAQNVERLEATTRLSPHHNLLFVLDNQPLAEAYLSGSWFYPVQVSKWSKTLYFPLREHQDVLEISNALRRLGGVYKPFEASPRPIRPGR